MGVAPLNLIQLLVNIPAFVASDQSIEVSRLTQPLLEMANCSKSLSRPALAPDYLVQSSACEI